jgi:hypothetical protein
MQLETVLLLAQGDTGVIKCYGLSKIKREYFDRNLGLEM